MGTVDAQMQEAVRAQLERMLAHEAFVHTKRLGSFLRHVIEQTLAGRGGELKEYTLGVEVFGRGTKFDPRLDSIVRVEASKLRSRLAAYYKGAGAADSVLIELTKGSYVPLITHRKPTAPARHSPLSIAVLPFVNLSLDSDGEYFADGLTEELINALSSLASLRVVARTSAFQFKGKAGNIQEIGARLGAEYVIEGSVRKAGDRLRVTAQLIAIQTGYHLWSQAYDETLTDVFAIQKALASAIVAALGQRVAKNQEGFGWEYAPTSIEAYQAYLRARFHRNQWTHEGFSKSIEYFRRAADYEPGYVQALAGLSEAYTLRAILGDVEPAPYFIRAREAATRAVAVSGHSAQAHLSLGWIFHIYDWRWEAAEAEIRRALELNPSFSEAHHLNGLLLGLRGRLREAAESFAKALQLDPLSLVVNAHAAMIPYFGGEYGVAEDQVRIALSMDRRFAEAHWILGFIHDRQRRYHEALEAFQTAIQLSGENPVSMGDRACVHAQMGDDRRARELLHHLETTFRHPHAAGTSIARIYFLLNEPGKSNAWLEKAFEAKDTMLPWICGDPRYEGLWSLPALREFRKQMISRAAVNG